MVNIPLVIICLIITATITTKAHLCASHSNDFTVCPNDAMRAMDGNHFAQLAHTSKFQSAKRRHCVQLRSSDGSVRHAHRTSYKCQTVHNSNEMHWLPLSVLRLRRIFVSFCLICLTTASSSCWMKRRFRLAITHARKPFIICIQYLVGITGDCHGYGVSPFIFTALHLQCGCSFDQNAFKFVFFFCRRLNIIFGVYLMR